MTPAGFDVDTIRGRLLHEQLLAEARDAIHAKDWPATSEPPAFPTLGRTDTGSLRAVVVAG